MRIVYGVKQFPKIGLCVLLLWFMYSFIFGHVSIRLEYVKKKASSSQNTSLQAVSQGSEVMLNRPQSSEPPASSPQSSELLKKLSQTSGQSTTPTKHFDPLDKLVQDYWLLENLSYPLFEPSENQSYLNDTSYFHLSKTPVTKIPNIYSILGRAVCSLPQVDLLLLILSVTTDVSYRLKIRQTWASMLYDSAWQQRTRVRLAFFFGDEALSVEGINALRNESQIYQDIAVAHFVDSYGNLSMKIVAALTWSVQYCPNARMVAKVDMDTVANIPVLLRFMLKVSEDHDEFIVGHEQIGLQPKVFRTGKWAVSQELYPYNYYPNYVSGHSYVIDNVTVQLLVKSFPYFQIVPNEDVFVTGVMRTILNVTRLTTKHFASIELSKSLCDVATSRVVTFLCRQENLDVVWSALTSGMCGIPWPDFENLVKSVFPN